MAETKEMREIIDMAMAKGYSQKELCEILVEHIKKLPPKAEFEKSGIEDRLMKEITQVLKEMGIPAHLKGYRYLRRAIFLAVKDSDIIYHITTELYPQLATEFGTETKRIERGIRNAIETSMKRIDKNVLKSCFGSTILLNRGKPTNGEFIAMIADKLSLKYNLS